MKKIYVKVKVRAFVPEAKPQTLTVAKGWPIGLDRIPSRSFPILKTNAIFIPGFWVSIVSNIVQRSHSPHPRMQATTAEEMIAKGTAVRAFVASSLM